MNTYDDWNRRAQVSGAISHERRALARHRRRWLRAWACVAVLGCALLAVYVTRPMPVDEWYIGAAGMALLLPWLTLRRNV